MNNWSIFKRYGYFWVTSILFLGSIVGHWLFAWSAFKDEQIAHGQEIELKEYFVEVSRDTLENWQSEFLQLMWQVAGLAFLFHVGSSQSKEGDERVEEKLDRIMEKVYGSEAKKIIADIDDKYARK